MKQSASGTQLQRQVRLSVVESTEGWLSKKVAGLVVGCLTMKTVVDPDHRLNTSHAVCLFLRHLKILLKVFTLCWFWVLMIISLLINPMEAWKLILHHGNSTIIISDLSD